MNSVEEMIKMAMQKMTEEEKKLREEIIEHCRHFCVNWDTLAPIFIKMFYKNIGNINVQ